MKLRDVRNLVDMPPQTRAEQYLALGNELQAIRKESVPKGTLPAPLNREIIQESSVGPLMTRLHGIRKDVPQKAKGLRETGRSLRTKAGTITDFVLTPQARKKMVATSLKQRGQDKSIADLATRQLALGMMESNPTTRCCAAYAYWQATGADAATPILVNAIESPDEEERILAAHCLAKMQAPQVKRLQGTAKDDRPQTPPQPL